MPTEQKRFREKRNKAESLEDALIKALGGERWMNNSSQDGRSKGLIDTFSPNNVQMIAICEGYVIIRRYIPTKTSSGSKLPQVIRVPFDINSRPKSNRSLNKILERRLISGLEEFYLDNRYESTDLYNRFLDWDRFKMKQCRNGYTDRVRVIAIIHNIPAQAVFEIFKNKKSLRYGADAYFTREFGPRSVEMLYKAKFDYNIGRRYNLESKYYEMDSPDGELKKEYERIQTGYVEMEMEDKARELIPYDAINYPYIKKFASYIKAKPKNELQFTIKQGLVQGRNKMGGQLYVPIDIANKALGSLERYHPKQLHGVNPKQLIQMLVFMHVADEQLTSVNIEEEVKKKEDWIHDCGMVNIKGAIGLGIIKAFEVIQDKDDDLADKFIETLKPYGNIEEFSDIEFLQNTTVENMMNGLDALMVMDGKLDISEEELKKRRNRYKFIKYKLEAYEDGAFTEQYFIDMSGDPLWREKEMQIMREYLDENKQYDE